MYKYGLDKTLVAYLQALNPVNINKVAAITTAEWMNRTEGILKIVRTKGIRVCNKDIPDEVFNIFEEHRKTEQSYQSKIHYYKAYYSLDRGDGIEHSALFVSLSPDEIYERKLTTEQLHTAIVTLPDKQAKRIYAHYFLGMSKTAIAKAEGVNKSQVTRILM